MRRELAWGAVEGVAFAVATIEVALELVLVGTVAWIASLVCRAAARVVVPPEEPPRLKLVTRNGRGSDPNAPSWEPPA